MERQRRQIAGVNHCHKSGSASGPVGGVAARDIPRRRCNTQGPPTDSHPRRRGSSPPNSERPYGAAATPWMGFCLASTPFQVMAAPLPERCEGVKRTRTQTAIPPTGHGPPNVFIIRHHSHHSPSFAIPHHSVSLHVTSIGEMMMRMMMMITTMMTMMMMGILRACM